MQTPKYKVGDYILISGKCDKELVGRTALIRLVDDDCYMLDLLDYPCTYYPVWLIAIADQNSTLNEAATVLYANADR